MNFGILMVQGLVNSFGAVVMAAFAVAVKIDTIISLGTRVMLAYTLSAVSWIGVAGIWGSIPIGWFLADVAGILLLKRSRTLKKSQDTV